MSVRPHHQMGDATPDASSTANPEELTKLISDAMKRSEALVKDALKLSKSLVGSDAEDLRLRIRGGGQ